MLPLDPPKKPDHTSIDRLTQHVRKVLDGFRAAVQRKRQAASSGSVGDPVQGNGKKGDSGPVGNS